MWCDDFDADLLKVVPGAVEALGPAASVQLQTYSRLTDEKINHPSCWHTDAGIAAFFWTVPEGRPPAGYSTDDPPAECTFLEAVRDEWVHDCVICVNRHVVWQPPGRLMERLMYDVRGWTVLTEAQRTDACQSVLRSLEAAAQRLIAATA